MTHEEFEASLKTAPGELEIYFEALANAKISIKNLSEFMAQDVSMMPRNSLALARLIDTAILLEHNIHEKKPQPQIIKYEYPDKTYHDQPYWDNAVYSRADDAYYAVLEGAKREYYRQQGVDVETNPFFNQGDLMPSPDPEEIINQAWTADDFTNEPKSYYAALLQGKTFEENNNDTQAISQADYEAWDKLFEELPHEYDEEGNPVIPTPENPIRFSLAYDELEEEDTPNPNDSNTKYE
jgi:hypothetical protein